MKQLIPYAAYQLKLRSGILRLTTPAGGWQSRLDSMVIESPGIPLHANPFGASQITDPAVILGQAEEILQGKFHPFSGPSARLTLKPGESPLRHWTQYGSFFSGQDIKFTWEPARFTWAYPLIHAAQLTGDDRYADCFWQHFDDFVSANPVNLGPNWASAQEVALRLLPLLEAWNSLKNFPSSTTGRREMLVLLVEQSAMRISATLDYARSQNNNHLLSEALGLILAGSFLADHHPLAARWQMQGFHEFERALLSQIESDGTYSQHSTNYHRLMLQLALIYYGYAQFYGHRVVEPLIEKLAAATRWLLAQTDPVTGRSPNLGHNDGTLILPFGASGYADQRPTLQAASLAFLQQPAFIQGPWDELAHWLGLSTGHGKSMEPLSEVQSPAVLKVGSGQTWGTLRAVQFHSRPAHADQLAVDLWWQGFNIAQDAGTYLYNAPPPWENALAYTCVHNTISLGEQDQIQHEGRFLWLKWIDASRIPQNDPRSQSASILWRTNPPIRHTRRLTFQPDDLFTIEDTLTPQEPMAKPIAAELQWLLPDWSYSMTPSGIILTHESLRIVLDLKVDPAPEVSGIQLSLIRAGETLEGSLQNPIRGWASPTYGRKLPALSLLLRVPLQSETQLISRWHLSVSEFKTG
jgi:hypothetical protein